MNWLSIPVATALLAVCANVAALDEARPADSIPGRTDAGGRPRETPKSEMFPIFAQAPTLSAQSDPDFVSPDDPEVVAAWLAGDTSSLAMDPRLYGRRWGVESINGSPQGVEGLEMTFKPRSFGGFDGCNRNSAVYYPSGTGMRFEPRFKQDRGCPGASRVERMKNFELAISILASATEFRFELPRLIVTSGRSTLVLSAR